MSLTVLYLSLALGAFVGTIVSWFIIPGHEIVVPVGMFIAFVIAAACAYIRGV